MRLKTRAYCIDSNAIAMRVLFDMIRSCRTLVSSLFTTKRADYDNRIADPN